MVEQQQTAALAVIVAFEVLGTIFVILRVWSRFLVSKESWGGLMTWSDVFLGLGWVFSVGETVALWNFTVTSHSGYHLKELLPGGIFYTTDTTLYVLSQKWLLAMELMYNPILGCIKNSAILFYLRLGISKKHLRLACYSFLAINNAILVSIFFADLFQCTPIAYKYDVAALDTAAQLKAGADANGMVDGKLITGGHCINKKTFILFTAGLTCLTDIMVIAIPLTMVWGLQMKLRKKILVGLVFSLGLSVTAAGIARIPIMYAILDTAHPNPDPTYGIGYTVSAIETGLALMTCCFPDLLPLLKQYVPKALGKSSGYDTNQRGAYYAKSHLRSGRKSGYVQTDSKNATLVSGSRARDVEGFVMEDSREWEGKRDVKVKVGVDVRGGYSSRGSSLAGSEEAIVADGKRIMRTTHITVQSQPGEKR